MDVLLTALADPARWRLVSLLAERPRSVGVLAQLAEARQPQTTKHLQTLERAGRRHRPSASASAASTRCGPARCGTWRRSSAGSPTPPDRSGGPNETFERHGLSLHAERLAADGAGVGRRPVVQRSTGR